MRRVVLSLLLCLPVAGPICAQVAPARESAAAQEGFVVTCAIEGMIDDGLAVVVERAVKEAEGAAAIIFEVNTFGGRVDSAIEITEKILDAPCPTIAYVDGEGAISAGALISYSCDEIIMAPGATIGASTPYSPGADVADQVEEKSNSFVRAKYRALGELKGHNPLLGEAMVDSEIELHGRTDENGRFVIFKVKEGKVVDSSASPGESKGAQSPVKKVLEKLGQELPAPLEDLERTVRGLLDGEKEEEQTEEQPEAAAAPTALPDGSVLVSEGGKLLTLTDGEALRYGLIAQTAKSIDEVMELHGYAGMRKHEVIPMWSEVLFRWLTSPLISGLLLLLGIGGLYIEIRTPGIGLAGIVGATCLAIFFGSYLVIGLADWIDILLVMVGIGLLFIELFILPGFGVVGIAGIFFLVIGVYLSLTRVPIPQYSWDFERLGDAGQTVAMAAISFAVLAVLSWKLFPRSPFYHMLVLSHAQDVDQGYVVQTKEQEKGAIGLKGVATSMLRPAGRGRFGNTTYDVVTRGEFVEKGNAIEIIEVAGNRYVVTECKEKQR